MQAGDRFHTFVPADMDDQKIRRLLRQLGQRSGVGIRRHGGRRDLVRNAHGVPLPCTWQDCWERGSTKHEVRVPHDAPGREGDTLTYVFCGPRHKAMWLGQLPPDKRPNSIIVP